MPTNFIHVWFILILFIYKTTSLKLSTFHNFIHIYYVYVIKSFMTHTVNEWYLNAICKDTLWIKPTNALNSNFIGITTLHVPSKLSAHHQEFLVVHRLWYILCSCDESFATRSRMELLSILLLVANGSSQLHKMYQSRCTTKNSWWWAERLPETCWVVITIKLEFSASVGFIHN